MVDRLGTPGAADKTPRRWVTNSLKVYRLLESLEIVPGSLLATAAKRYPSELASKIGPTMWSHENGQILFGRYEEDLGRKV